MSLQDSVKNNPAMKLAETVIKETIIIPLIEEGTLIRREMLRSYLKINFDEIYNHVSTLSNNCGLSLELIKDIIDEVQIEELFNMHEWADNGIEIIKTLNKDIVIDHFKKVKNKIFDKFYFSYLWHTYPETVVLSIAETMVIKKVDFEEVKDIFRKSLK